MIRLKTRTTLKRHGARVARITRGLELTAQRTALHSSAAANRHCSIYLASARRAGQFNPPGGARVRGEP